MDTSEDNEKGAAGSAGSDGAMKEMQGLGAAGVGKQLQSSASTRRLSAESQDFEFNKLGDMVSPYNAKEQSQAGLLASADELFYKGQLLPLQYSNATWSHHHLHSATISSSLISSPTLHELPFESLSSQLLSRDQDHAVRFSSSCRMDNQLNLNGLDSSLFDFRCSSFRSHSSKYSSYYCNYYANYGSNCSSNSSRESSTTGGESSSSSRDSNGSSQDSACSSHPDHTHIMREHHLCCCCCHGQSAHLLLPSGSHHCPKRKHGLIQSWRLLIHGLKRGSSHHHQTHHKSSKFCNIHGDLRAASGELSHTHSSSSAANQGSTGLTCGCKAQACRKGYSTNDERPRSSTGLKACEKDGIRTQLSADNHGPAVSEVKKGHKAPSTTVNGASNHSVSSKWQGYTKRIKPISMIKARLVGSNHHGQEMSKGGTQSAARAIEEEKGCSKRRVTRKPSLDRKFSQPSLCDSSVKGLSNLQVSFRFHGAVSSSCPASVRSSPNHSGLLSPPSTTMSTMQELHSAVQGAIAHCKQSNSAHTVAHTPSS